MALLTYEQQLEQVQTAITALIEQKVQSYSLSTPTGSRSYTLLNLKDLLEWQEQLQEVIARQARGGIRISGATPV